MERLGSLDAVFLAIENEASPMNIGSVAVFDGPAPSFDAVQAFVAAKLPQVPRCRQRVRESARNVLRPVWIDDVRFDLADHLHHVALPAGNQRALEEFVEQVMVEPLDRGRALWEMWVVESIGDGRWAVVSKMHHCVVDGIAGTDLLAVMLDHAPDVEHPPADAWRPTPEPSGLEVARFGFAMVLKSLRVHARHLVEMLGHPTRTWRRLRDIAAGARGLWLQPSRPDSPLTGPIGPRRRWAHTQMSLEDVATIRHALGGTVNDVVLAATAQGLRELLRTRGVMLEGRDVMALVPVSIRAPSERGLFDNRVAVTHALLPVGIDDPAATLAAIRAHLDDLKVSHQTDASTVLLHTGDLTPHAVASVVARAVVRAQQNLETIVTNVPGPRRPMYLCGRRMLEAYPFAPIAGRIRVVVAIWSYCGTLFFGVTGDREGASDLDALVAGIDLGFRRLLVAAVDRARAG